ncbi:MAG: rRNA maturation protein [Methanosarcina barkeri]|nr:rRNA maturation protein [Methanosarcina sp. ERenArc_MAG2]
MLITSSRKPSAKTRTLCKLLSRFIAGRSMTRGKMGMQELLEFVEGGPLIVVGEYHGNPGELSFFDEGKLLFLSDFRTGILRNSILTGFRILSPCLQATERLRMPLSLFSIFRGLKAIKLINSLPVPP